MKESTVQIDLSALQSNAAEIKKKYSEYNYIIGVVKGDAYGHGMESVNALSDGGIDYFAVSSIEEAIELRRCNQAVPVLCLQPVDLDYLEIIKKNAVTLCVHSLEYLDRLIECVGDAYIKVHLKIDTGMNRLGFKDKIEVLKAAEKIKSCRSLELEGVFQHFATVGIFDPHWDEQVSRFKELTSLIDLDKIPMVHAVNGVNLFAHPKLDFCNTARIGIAMYGYNVAPVSYGGGVKNKLRTMRDKHFVKKYNLSPVYKDITLDLKPAMTLKCGILQIKSVKKGEFVGYDAAYTAPEDMYCAVLPVGYNNGIGHKNLNRRVLINGKYYPIIGEICMNMIIVRVDSSVTTDDEVTLLGDKITLGQFSRGADLTNSEALLMVGKNNKKIYTKR